MIISEKGDDPEENGLMGRAPRGPERCFGPALRETTQGVPCWGAKKLA